MNRSIFYEDWRDCLRAHYLHVIRTNDTNNEASLYTVLRDTGFSDDEIADMRGIFPPAEGSLAASQDIAEPAFQETDQEAYQQAADPVMTFSEEIQPPETSDLPEPVPEPLPVADDPALEQDVPPKVVYNVPSAPRPMQQQSLFDGF